MSNWVRWAMFLALGAMPNFSSAAQNPIPAIKVETTFCEKKEVVPSFRYPAVVAPEVHGRLTSEIEGVVTRIFKHLGQGVKKGEPVFSLRNTQVGLRFREYTVRAPVTGVVSELSVTLGQLVEPGESNGSVTDPRQQKLVVEAPARDVPHLKSGLVARFELHGQHLEAQVRGVSPIVNPKTGTARVELVPTTEDMALVPGAVGRATVYLEPINAVTVPVEALVRLGEKVFVRTIDQDVVKMAEVQLGRLVAGEQLIRQGLDSRTEIVVRATDHLKDGDKIERVPSQSPAGSQL